MPPDYAVFHSIAWQLRSRYGDVQDGETDFLITHPDFGILIVEVKGGRIRYDGAEGQWYTYDEPMESEDTRPSMLHITNFHRLADESVEQAGLPTGPYNSEYFETILPDRLMEAVDKLGSQYDAIIVDEGQDFYDNWWFPLQCLLHDPDQGIFYVFFDDNQNIYQGTQQMPLESAPFPLPHNCRNTQYIHQQILSFYRAPSNCPRPLVPRGGLSNGTPTPVKLN